MTAACHCCDGTGRLHPERPLCPCAIGRRDTRSPGQLRRMAALQQLALTGITFDRDGDLLPEHGEPYVDYNDGRVRR